jgi:hypothetical protein
MDSGLIGVWSIGIAEDRIRSIRSVVNPDKLAHLGPVSGLTRCFRVRGETAASSTRTVDAKGIAKRDSYAYCSRTSPSTLELRRPRLCGFGPRMPLRAKTHQKPRETTGNSCRHRLGKPLQIPPIEIRIVLD